jgi:hypothetical protein
LPAAGTIDAELTHKIVSGRHPLIQLGGPGMRRAAARQLMARANAAQPRSLIRAARQPGDRASRAVINRNQLAWLNRFWRFTMSAWRLVQRLPELVNDADVVRVLTCAPSSWKKAACRPKEIWSNESQDA